MTRYIIEGMQQDQAHRMSYVAREGDIPFDVEALSLGANTLRFVGYRKPGSSQIRAKILQGPTIVLSRPGPAALLEHDSPQTVIVEDGRVFTCADPARLHCTLEDFVRADGFEKVFADCKQDPAKMFD